MRNFSTEAKSAYKHYLTKKEFISDENSFLMHVFKAAMLLIAVMSSGNVSNLYSQTTQRKISASRNTLYKCFAGQLTKDDVNGYLDTLSEIELISLDPMTNGDARFQIPYTGGGDVFDIRKAMLVKKYSRYELFKKGGHFSKSIEAKIWDKNNPSYNRVYIAGCCSETLSIDNRFGEVQVELQKNPYKFGVLVIAVSEGSQFSFLQTKVKDLAASDKTGRFAVYLLKSPLTEEHLDRWYNAMTHSELAEEEGKDGGRYLDEASVIIEEWSAPTADDQIMAACGSHVYPSEYGAGILASKLEKDIIFGTVFTAAPEIFLTTNTAFKKMQQTTAEAGIKKSSPNSQVGSIVNGLKQVGVWNADTLNDIVEYTGKPGATATSAIARFISEKFSQGTQIKLDALWQELQKPPYGYYNCMACGYILGFMLRHFVNSEFSWNQGDNNPWQLTEQNLATMITKLCKGDVVNNYLSPGTEVWRKFKPYVQKVFKLTDGEAVNETEARKYISKQCTEKAGVPFWALKFLPDDKFGGAGMKQSADTIIDLFCDFMSGNGDQEKVMSDITVQFTGRGPVRKALSELYFDQNTAYSAFSDFISRECAEMQELREAIQLTNYDIFDAIHQLMQGQISTWTEEQVKEKLEELRIEYRAVVALNKALGLKRKSIKSLSDDITNAFNNMKVPGSVIETLDFTWIPTLKAMRTISTTQWSKIEVTDRRAYTELIKQDAQSVWGNVTTAKLALEKYMEKHGHHCTKAELEDIYNALKVSQYDASSVDFDNKISSQLNNIAYNRNKQRIQELWEAQSESPSVDEWCGKWAVPIQWVVTDEEQLHITVLITIQSGKKADNVVLHNATQYFENHTISSLKDNAHIMNCFFAQIGENYREAFNTSGTVLVSRLKTNAKLSADVFSWGNKVGEVRRTLDDFLRNKYCDDAKKKVKTMPEDTLRNKVIALLEQNPDLYTLFIK